MEVLKPSKRPLWPVLMSAVIFAAAMGILEAICVIYLRHLLSPAEQPVAALRRFPVEQIREACTLTMLVTVAWLAGSNTRTRGAWFFLMFGVWDIAYYVGLKCLAHWPSSWLEWDTLFLIPMPWNSPVLAPILISAYLVVGASVCIVREDDSAPPRWRLFPALLQLAAAVFWYVSFANKTGAIAVQGYRSASYSWSLLTCGLVCSGLGLFLAMRSGTWKGARRVKLHVQSTWLHDAPSKGARSRRGASCHVQIRSQMTSATVRHLFDAPLLPEGILWHGTNEPGHMLMIE